MARGRGRPSASERIVGYWSRLRSLSKAKKTHEEIGVDLGVHPSTVKRDLEKMKKQRRRSKRGKAK